MQRDAGHQRNAATQRVRERPMISCPKASPASVPVSVNCTPTDEDTERSSAIRGRAGRYMSMVSGPRAIISPRTAIIRSLLGATCSVVTPGDVATTTASVAPRFFFPTAQ